MIAGAGPAGVEVAGEVKSAFPDKTVTLVGTFLAACTPRLQKRIHAALEKMGVEFADGRVEVSVPDANGTVTTTTGKSIPANVVLNTAGFTYQGKSLASASLQADVTEHGQFKCRPHLAARVVFL